MATRTAAAQIGRFRETNDQLAERLVPIRERLGLLLKPRSEPNNDEHGLPGVAHFDNVRATHGGLTLSFFLEDLQTDAKSERLHNVLSMWLEDSKPQMTQPNSERPPVRRRDQKMLWQTGSRGTLILSARLSTSCFI